MGIGEPVAGGAVEDGGRSGEDSVPCPYSIFRAAVSWPRL